MKTLDDKMTIQVIDDNKAYRYLLKTYLTLKMGKENLTFIEDELASDSIDHFSQLKPDCVLLDYRLPDADGFSVLKSIRELDANIPVIVLTSEGDEFLAVKFLKEGASYYLPKKGLGASKLYDAITECFKTVRDINKDEFNESDIFNIMAHEIKTPLNTIIMASDLLNSSEDEYDQKQCIDSMVQSANHLLKISSNILNLSKLNSGTFQLNLFPGSLVENIKRILSYTGISHASSKIHLESSFKGDFPAYVMADFFFFKQVILNLINNAYKYTVKGSINLEVLLLEENEKSIQVRFSVVDTGIGIPKDKLAEIFNKYKQVCPEVMKTDGVGLGLTICQTLLRAMDSSLEVVSEVGKGTTFSFELTLLKFEGLSVGNN